ncbi:MAG: alkaline phosphatase [Bacteroidetes bacterium]|nr:alkaline phosphatase [Bacteroidota bacterium]MCL2302499.1 alkaline phosphatase [Lentimicrobiaceae bacterium]
MKAENGVLNINYPVSLREPPLQNLKGIILPSPFSLLLSCFLLFSLFPCSAQAPKHIFLFIGDGLGIGTLTYSEIIAKEKGETLCFSQFPVTGLMTTHSADDLVTCSASAVTAMASGEKTKNSMLNIAPDSVHILTPISKILHQKGYWIGVATTVSLDHATPAGFYAHSLSRKNYYDIAKQLPASGFRFFAGSGFLDPEPKDSVSIFALLRENGYAVFTSIHQCFGSKSLKNVLIQPQDKDNVQLPYSISKDKNDFTLAQITQLGIQKLSALNEPFFFMIEGGLIDWAAHDNLAEEVYGEVKEFSEAIEVALAFYKEHPKETLIIVAADHETGGAMILSDGLHFNSEDHTGSIVPVFAIGAGAEVFSGLYDNTKIPKKILHLLR